MSIAKIKTICLTNNNCHYIIKGKYMLKDLEHVFETILSITGDKNETR